MVVIMLLLMLDNQESVSISDTSVKQVYQSMIGKRFIPPVAKKSVTEKSLNISQNCLDWKNIWKNANNTNIDHELDI